MCDEREEYAAAAEHLSAGLDALADAERRPVVVQRRVPAAFDDSVLNSMTARLHWLHLMAARARGDRAEVDQRVQRVLSLGADADGLASDLVPILRELGRHADADRMFDRSEAGLRGAITLSGEDPEHLNNLAWLLARCDVHLEEALELARHATALSPYSAAYLDTLAEVLFRLGRGAEAVEIERRALSLRPHDPFMMRQLRRFGGAP
jgi:Flp pilus assembly protein TadD